MVLYCVDIPVLVYPMLLHKIGINPDEKSVLFIDKHHFTNEYDIDAVRAFKKQGIFADIVEFTMICNRRPLKEKYEEKVVEHFDKMFEASGYKPDDFEAIYVLVDTWEGDIALYFNIKKIPYTLINHLQNYEPPPYRRFEWLVKMDEKYNFLTPYAEYCTPQVLESSDVIIGKLKAMGKSYLTWNDEKIYSNMTKSAAERLADCYRMTNLSHLKNNTLLVKNSDSKYLSTSFSDLDNKEYVETILGTKQFAVSDFAAFVDKVALDFFADASRDVYIKEHPNFPINEAEWEIYGKSVNILSTKMPFELLTKYILFNKIKFDSIIGYFSASLITIDSAICKNKYILGREFLKTWYFYSSIYAALCFAYYSGLECIYCSKVLKTQFDCLLRTVDFDMKIEQADYSNLSECEKALVVLDALREWSFVDTEFFNKLPESSALCFANIELGEEFFDMSLMPYFAPIEIKKEKISEGFMNLQRDERLWIYSKNPKVLKSARYFTFQKTLAQCGLQISAGESTFAKGMELFTDMALRNSARNMSVSLEYLSKFSEKVSDEALLLEMLKEETDFSRYLSILGKIKDKYLIVLAIRDTAGARLPYQIIHQLHEFGFTNFTKEPWRMYAGVINKGEVVFNGVGSEREETVSCQIKNPLFDFNLTVSSKAWRKGNKAEILINGVNYAVNLRGVNFVVYDLDNKKLVDSVAFDYHTEKRIVKRKSNI